VTVSLRPATTWDAPLAGTLIHLAMGPLADALFARADARAALAHLFAYPSNRFSVEYAEIAELDGTPVGLLVGYPGSELPRLAWGMAARLPAVLGLSGALRLAVRSLPLARLPEAERHEYLIHALAVLPEARGRGLGTRLLEEAERRAVALRLGACSLTVAGTNRGARALYERLGYRVVQTARSAALGRMAGDDTLHRMVKRLLPAGPALEGGVR